MDSVLHFAVARMMGDFAMFFCNAVNFGLADRYRYKNHGCSKYSFILTDILHASCDSNDITDIHFVIPRNFHDRLKGHVCNEYSVWQWSVVLEILYGSISYKGLISWPVLDGMSTALDKYAITRSEVLVL